MEKLLRQIIYLIIFLTSGLGLAISREPDESASTPKFTVAAITMDFIAVDITQNGGCDWRAFTEIMDPPVTFEYKIGSGVSHMWDTLGATSIPSDYFDGTAFYFPGAVVGEAVLIKVASETFPSDIKTYITYNVATSGSFDGTQLHSSQPPPYYNTIPVEAKFWNRQAANPGYTGVTLAPVFCDSYTTPSIGIPAYDDISNFIIFSNPVLIEISSPNLNQFYDHEFPPQGSINHGYVAFYWGPSGSTIRRELYLGTSIPPDPLLHYQMNLKWPVRSFKSPIVISSIEFGKVDSYSIPMEGGHGAIQLLVGLTVGRIEELKAIPAPNLLLEAAIEALEGRAILSSHLFPLCDVNGNGVIDPEDLDALREMLTCGVMTY